MVENSHLHARRGRSGGRGSLVSAALTVVALGLFYGVTIVVVVGLFLTPVISTVGVFALGISVPIYALLIQFPLTWFPAYYLAHAVASARPAPFRPPGPPLDEADVPGFFKLLSEVAEESGTRMPDWVYLTHGAQACVAEHGDSWRKKQRVLILGCVHFDHLTVAEMRSVLAHELGHFACGHTAYAGLRGHTWALFRSMARVQESQSTDPFQHWTADAGTQLGRALVGSVLSVFGWLYLRATLPGARRDELDADAHSAHVVGPEIAASALEKVSTVGPLFDHFLASDCPRALQLGVVPSDLIPAFRLAREQYKARGIEDAIIEEMRRERTTPFDTHPSLPDRKRHLRSIGGTQPDSLASSEVSEPARALLGDHFEGRIAAQLRAFADKQNLEMGTFQELASTRHPQETHTHAKAVAAQLYGQFPKANTLARMLRAVAKLARTGDIAAQAHAWNHQLNQPLTAGDRQTLVQQTWFGILHALLAGALLDQGAAVDWNCGGEDFRFVLDGQSHYPAVLVGKVVKGDRAASKELVLIARALVKRETPNADADSGDADDADHEAANPR